MGYVWRCVCKGVCVRALCVRVWGGMCEGVCKGVCVRALVCEGVCVEGVCEGMWVCSRSLLLPGRER